MAKHMFDAGRWTVAESWRVIRTVRADPPAKIKRTLTGERMVVFQAALEQAQQQFATSSSIGYESRSLNLFYGLSQAGRALVAASGDISERQTEAVRLQRESTGHGARDQLRTDRFAGRVLEIGRNGEADQRSHLQSDVALA